MKAIFSTILFCLLSFNAWGLVTETDSFRTIQKTIEEQTKDLKPSEVLVVFDVDNTLLTMPQSFGSDQWLHWQERNCIKKKDPAGFCVADNKKEFVDLVGEIWAITDTVTTDKSVPGVVKALQDKGYKVIVLTARPPEFRSITEQSLKENKMDFKESAIGSAEGFPATFIPFSAANPESYGLTKSDVKAMEGKEARPVSYMNGIYMASEQNKGLAIKTLLKKTGTNVKAVYFADDQEYNTSDVENVMGKVDGVKVTSFRYSKMDPAVKAFEESDKKDAIEAWNTFKTAKEKVFESAL